MAWLGRDLYGLCIYNKCPYIDILYSPFVLSSVDGIVIKLPDDADEKLIERKLEIGENPVEIK